MNYLNTTCLIALVFCLSAATRAQVSTSTYGKPITVQSGAVRIDTLLNHFARQTGVEFSFSTAKVRPSQTITVPQRQQSLSQWLKTLQQSLGIQHKVVGNHIILYEANNTSAHTQQPPAAPAANSKGRNKVAPPTIRIHIDSTQHRADTAARQPATKTAGRQSGNESAAKQTATGTVSNQQAPQTAGRQSTNESAAKRTAAGTTSTPTTSGVAATQATTTAGKAISGKSAAQEARIIESLSLVTQTGIKPVVKTSPTSPAGNARSTKTSATRTAQPPASAHSNRRNETIDDDEDAAPDDEAIQLLLGYSKHGGGDYDGIVFAGSYAKYLSQQFSLTVDLRGTMNWRQDQIIEKDQLTGQVTDRSIRLLTAGVQLGILGGFSPVHSAHHEVMINLGPFGRFQSCASGSDGYSTYPPRVSNLPFTVVEFWNTTPQHTITLGALLQVQYRWTLGPRITLGIAGGFQTDTEGDVIQEAAITIGKRF
ncbi:hypothetical protein [Paraflavitalea sp. CAU 1676]|uniref:hypothetical protein n=1 Tax=Paraflavitalea sp. CAU 1676 TaxID=3032598 RepID=UPI0023DB4AA6|nr:hypothetical protein [Paraflavitalea sp. CAU 1676]MDF2192122.1 hypothetical protein [Paraflavitalea sp. CAU 1676]